MWSPSVEGGEESGSWRASSCTWRSVIDGKGMHAPFLICHLLLFSPSPQVLSGEQGLDQLAEASGFDTSSLGID